MTRHRALPLLASIAIGGLAATAAAQVEKRDHRNEGVEKRDHRDEGVEKRDHRADRDAKKRRPPRDVKPADPKDQPNVEVRDHRGDAEVEVRDHRGDTKVEVRDHRGQPVKPNPNAPVEEVIARRPRPVAQPQIPVVSSFFPRVGGVDTKVTVRGQRFDDEIKVTVGGVDAAAVNVTPRIITFRVPKDPANGTIFLQHPSMRRRIPVGVIDLDAKAPQVDRKRRDAERHERAQKRWEERRKKLAKDEAERAKAFEERRAELERTREERREKRREELRAKWEQAFLSDAQVQAELALHADRSARLARMLRLAEARDKAKLGIRIEILIDKEDARHERRMELLKTSFSAEADVEADAEAGAGANAQ